MPAWHAWILWGGEFSLARFLLQRGLALTHLLVVLVAARQFRGLVDEERPPSV